MAEIRVPEQLTFRRREVMQLTKLDGRVLDFWETEFAAFQPVVNKSGEKYYSRRDVETILLIRQLLVVEKRDRDGVRQLLSGGSAGEAAARGGPQSPQNPVASGKKLREVRRQLREILTLLDKNDKQ